MRCARETRRVEKATSPLRCRAAQAPDSLPEPAPGRRDAHGPQILTTEPSMPVSQRFAPRTSACVAELALVSPKLAIVSLRGEYDRGGYERLKEALDKATAHGDILVDPDPLPLRQLLHHRRPDRRPGGRDRAGRGLALLVGRERGPGRGSPRSTRLAEIMAVHTARGTAFASFGRP
jgi:hypothetical protein